MLSTQTLVIVGTNLLTMILSAALALLVFWQSPRQRVNQLFVLMVCILFLHGVVNITSRFVDPLNLDADLLFDLSNILYAWFITVIYFFADKFSPASDRRIPFIALGLNLTINALVILDLTNHNTIPSVLDLGGYVTQYTPIGLIGLGGFLSFVLVTMFMLRRSADRRAQAVWPALAVMLGGVILVALRPLSNTGLPFAFLFSLPYGSLSELAAAYMLGRAVLSTQLFDPMRQLNLELQSVNQQLESASRLKSQFLANMSHELRTPLNSIIGYTQLVLDGIYGPVTDKQRDRLDKVARNGHNLLSLINDILDLSKIEAGQLILQPERVSVSELLQSITATFEPLAESKGIHFQVIYPDDAFLNADPVRARQILINLVANAVKFTRQGEVTLTARQNGSMMSFAVADTGIGIPQDSLKLIFEEFRQVDNSTTREYEGTGLGLAITRRLAELHGGTVSVESTVGKGSTFTVTLPLVDVALPAGPPTLQGSAGPLILAIDDNPDAIGLIQDYLGRDQYRVLGVNSGREGIEQARRLKPHAITLDVMMPGMDGWQVLSELKANPETAHIPVIMVSVVNDFPLAYSLGASGCVLKPINPGRLLETLQRVAPSHSDHPVLVVVSSDSERSALEAILRSQNKRAFFATTAAAAREWLMSHSADLIVLDLVLPDESGLDLLAFIRDRHTPITVPVVVVATKEITQEEETLLRERYAALVQNGGDLKTVLSSHMKEALSRL